MARKDISSSAKVLAFRLAAHHNQNTGRCNPSLPTLARGTGKPRSVVYTNLVALREAGLIDWTTGNSSTSNSYVLKDVEIHDPKAKPTSPVPERGKGPKLRLVPKDDPPAPETVRSTGLPPSGQPDYPPSGLPDPNTPILTSEGTLSPSTPSEDTASPLSPEGRRGETDDTHTSQRETKVERQSKLRATAWPDDLG
ncbi:helix-turn-helix domain-containing protein [Methylobacterium sp. J-076]|uniref:helix-turn-helix domain-containing protein n=1 Tax=Methylobacterium sp. J-076 TaxID=2836655 RepID=UPI00391CB634